MNFRIKIFSVILVVCMGMAFGLWFFFRASVEQGFWSFLQEREMQMLQPLIDALQNEPLAHGEWSDRFPDERSWRRYLITHTQPPRAAFTPSPMHAGPMRPPKPLFLLDHNKNPVRGHRWVQASAHLIPLQKEASTLGYLGIPLRPQWQDLQETGFVRDQGSKLVLITLTGLTVATLVALWASAWLVRRIRQLVGKVNQLSQGHYQLSMPIMGHDELNQLDRQIHQLATTLEQSRTNRKQWVADISHELRTPLAVLTADLEALQDGIRPLGPDAVTRLQQQVGRLTQLVGDLYELSLADIGALTYRMSPCNLQHLLQDCLEPLRATFAEKGLTLTQTLSTQGPPLVLADAQRLHQLLTNLLTNTLNYTDPPGQVHLSLRIEGQTLTLTLDDSPPGVPAADHERLFERLYRQDESRSRVHGGAGLGLSLCQRIAEAHQGHLKASDSPLGGLRIELTLPLLEKN